MKKKPKRPKKKRGKTERQKLIIYLDTLFREICLIRAGYKSELSGTPAEYSETSGKVLNLDVHHIVRKPNDRLRYEIENGIVLTNYQHRYGIHGNHEEEYRELIKKVRGQDIYERMAALRWETNTDLKVIKIYLEQTLKELKNE